MYQQSEQEKLKDLFAVRNTLLNCQNTKDVVHKALAITHDRLHPQTASVFLFSKAGLLERIGILGSDKDGLPIADDWFCDEKYNPGESFTGKAVIPGPNSSYGLPQWSFDLEQDDINPRSRSKYTEKLGTLACAIAVPLNGAHRTYGVLEVINKLDDSGKPNPRATFSKDDLYWLSVIGTNVATAISDIRRRSEFALLADISRMIVQPFGSDFSPVLDSQGTYSRITSQLVGPLTSYKACILRIGTSAEPPRVVAKAGDSISWETWDHEPTRKGIELALKVYTNGKPEIVGDIDARINDFAHVEWIRSNDFKSYACFPLLVQTRVVGTLSLFMSFRHEFYDSDINFLNNLCFLTAMFAEASRVIDELNARREEVAVEREKLQRAARVVGYDLSVQQVYHQYRNELMNLQHALEESEKASPGRRAQILKERIEWINKRVEEIGGELKSAPHMPLNIGHIAQAVVRYFSLETKGKDIQFSQELSPELPEIMANEDEIREIVYNLVSNAVKAVLRAGRRRGDIKVTTAVVQKQRKEFIQLTVEDNGVGIRNEDREMIYERNFSRLGEGTGMGLFITRKIVMEYGGEIDYVSSVGRGTTFFVWLPLTRLRA
jgi:signal transduction histidine kinase